MKTLIVASAFTLLTTVGVVHATDELEKPPVALDEVDSHISWHEFRHELLAFPGVNASMDHDGVITVVGHTKSLYDKRQIGNLATKVRGATNVNNRILTD